MAGSQKQTTQGGRGVGKLGEDNQFLNAMANFLSCLLAITPKSYPGATKAQIMWGYTFFVGTMRMTRIIMHEE